MQKLITQKKNYTVAAYIDHIVEDDGQHVLRAKWVSFPDPKCDSWEPLPKEAK